jgi:cytochrome c-type biogenesis protein CcmH
MLGAVLGLLLASAAAFTDDGRLNDPALEARAEHLGLELRCLVCESATIEDSPAPLAADLRHLVRERIVAGDSDKQIRSVLVSRYGEFVLFRPPFEARNVVLWAGPFVLLLGAGAALLWRARSRRRAAS